VSALEIPAPDAPHNAGELLLSRLRSRGDGAAVRCEGIVWSGERVAASAFSLHAELERRGLEPGDRVLLVLRDTPAFFAGFLGAMRGGYLPVPVSTLLPPKDLAFIAHDSGARAVLIDAALPEALRAASLLAGGCARIDCEEQTLGIPAHRGPPPRAAVTRAGEDAFWLYTSGTTGEPKGVVHRHLDLIATAALYAEPVLGLGPADRVLSAAKLFFAYGLGNSLGFPIWLGAESVLHPDRATPEAMFRLLREERPTVFFGVPTLYASMLAHPDLPPDLGRVRLCVSAGEALPAPLLERWRARFGVEVLDGLGSTEMLHIFVSNRPGAVRPGSSGRALPGYRVRIVDEEDEDVPAGEVGTLLAGGPSAALRYHGRPELSRRTMPAPGWLRTGDSYRADADGYLFHVGRTDELMKVSGQWVSPVEVEAALAEHPAVIEAAVVADQDRDGLTRPRAFVVVGQDAPPRDVLAEQLRAHVKARLAPHKYPRRIDFVDELPRTATGKLRRLFLREEPG
jgi:benzoate-CoA ligase